MSTPTISTPPPEVQAIKNWWVNLPMERKGFVYLGLIIAAVVAVILLIVGISSSFGGGLPVSPQQVSSQLTGTTAPDGTTVTRVTVVGTPTAQDGNETGKVDVEYSDGTVYRETFNYSKADNEITAIPDYQESGS